MATLPLLAVACAGCSRTSSSTAIRYVVVVVKENRTFDNYFGTFPGAEGALTAVLSDGGVIDRPRAPRGAFGRDPGHGRDQALLAWADGGMNGFDLVEQAARPPDGGADDYLSFSYYDEQELPNYWQYAKHFVLADHFFSTSLGPSTPGHLATVTSQAPTWGNLICLADCDVGYACSATTGSVVQTVNPDTCETGTQRPCFDIPSIVDQLPEGFSWRAYAARKANGLIESPLQFVRSLGEHPDQQTTDHFRAVPDLLEDLLAGDQPNLILANVGEAPNHGEEGPPAGPCGGENLTVDWVNAIMNGPHWKQTAIVLTWDDWGGLYDHVAPPVEVCANGQVFNPGFRLPALIISPYAKQGVVLHETTEQASIPRLVEDLFGMPRMATVDPHARDARAGSLLGAFDFTQDPRPPLLLSTHDCP